MSRELYIKKCAPIDLYYISTKKSGSTETSVKSEYLSRMGELYLCVGEGENNGSFFTSAAEAKKICEIWGFIPIEDCHPSIFLRS
jgi:hypothetical protein